MLLFGLIFFALTSVCQDEDNEQSRITISARSLDVRGFVGQRFDVMFGLPQQGYNAIVTSSGRRPFENTNCSTALFNCSLDTGYSPGTIALSGVFSKELLFAYIEGHNLLTISIYFFVNYRWNKIPGNPFFVPNSLPFYVNTAKEWNIEFNCSLDYNIHELKLYAEISRKLFYHVDKNGRVVMDKRDEFKNQIVSIRMLNDEAKKLVTFAVQVKPKENTYSTYYYACNSGDSWIFFDIDHLDTETRTPVYPPLIEGAESEIPTPLQLSMDVRGPAGNKFYSSIPLPGNYTHIRSSRSSPEIAGNPTQGYYFDVNISRAEPRTANIEGYILRGLQYIYFTGRHVIPVTVYISANFRWPVFYRETFATEHTLPMVIGGRGRREVTVSWKLDGYSYEKFFVTGRATNELIYKYNGTTYDLSHKFPEIDKIKVRYKNQQERIYFNATKHADIDYYCLRYGSIYLTHIVDWNAPEMPPSAMPPFLSNDKYPRPPLVNFPVAPTIGEKIPEPQLVVIEKATTTKQDAPEMPSSAMPSFLSNDKYPITPEIKTLTVAGTKTTSAVGFSKLHALLIISIAMYRGLA